MTLLVLFDPSERTAEDDTGSLQKFIRNQREIREARLEAEIVFPFEAEAKLNAEVEVPASYTANLKALLEVRTRAQAELQAEVALPAMVTGIMRPEIIWGLTVNAQLLAEILRRESRDVRITGEVGPPSEIDIYRIYKIQKIREAIRKHGHAA